MFGLGGTSLGTWIKFDSWFTGLTSDEILGLIFPRISNFLFSGVMRHSFNSQNLMKSGVLTPWVPFIAFYAILSQKINFHNLFLFIYQSCEVLWKIYNIMWGWKLPCPARLCSKCQNWVLADHKCVQVFQNGPNYCGFKIFVTFTTHFRPAKIIFCRRGEQHFLVIMKISDNEIVFISI